MKYQIALLLTILTAGSAWAWDDHGHRRDCRDVNRLVLNGQSCVCVEVERRIEGMQNLLRYARLGSMEERDAEYTLRLLQEKLDSVDFSCDSVATQFDKCARPSSIEDRVWGRWQPWLSREGLDRPNRCETELCGRY